MLNENRLNPFALNEGSKYFTLFQVETGGVKKDSFLMDKNESTGYKGAFILFDIGMDTVNNNLINTTSSTF